MEDKSLPQSVGETLASQESLTPPQEELCKRIDSLHRHHGLKSIPSNMFHGANYILNTSFQSNPDWLAQAANSLREILYPFNGKAAPKLEDALKSFGSIVVDNDIKIIQNKLHGLAHHGNGKGRINFDGFTESDFKKLMSEFEIAMINTLKKQTDVHEDIDELFNETN